MPVVGSSWPGSGASTSMRTEVWYTPCSPKTATRCTSLPGMVKVMVRFGTEATSEMFHSPVELLTSQRWNDFQSPYEPASSVTVSPCA